MDKKIIPLLIVLICSLCCLGMVSADDNTTDNITASDVEDMADYIIPLHITDNGIEFSDGFIGFCMDSSKPTVTVNDKFTSQPTRNDEAENNIKLAIIEAYKAGKENDLGGIVTQVLNGNKEYDVVKSVFSSTQTVTDSAVVNINNTTEATFTFELLKSDDDLKSDCLAYKVSFKTIEDKELLKATNDNSSQSAANESANQTSTPQETTTKSNGTAGEPAQAANASEDNRSTEGQTIINKTNKTIINKTNTVIVNENNTTVINKNTTKVINKTNDNPKNATVQQQIMRTVGNPIFLLAIVIVIIAIVGVVMRRKN